MTVIVDEQTVEMGGQVVTSCVMQHCTECIHHVPEFGVRTTDHTLQVRVFSHRHLGFEHLDGQPIAQAAVVCPHCRDHPVSGVEDVDVDA